ncbi:MAG TPA: Gfo/Idh/MocA family oxidoreductase [Abditibacterium sp.]|jgi:predicted dehydrogenase
MSLKWGLIGCGWVARDYVVPALLAAPSAQLVALCDPNLEALSAIEAPGATRFSDANVFWRADFDAVYIATPNHLHGDLTIAAARAKKHVWCEKPMALSLEDAQSMTSACEAASVTYATAFDQRFHDAHQKLHALIAAGELGQISAIRIHYACWTPPDWVPPTQSGHDNWRVDPKRAGGGAFIDLAPHGLDLAQFLLGEELTEVRCFFQNAVFDYGVDDGAALIGRFPSGALLTHQVAYNCPDAFPRRTLEVVGTRAMAILRNTMGQTPGGNFQLIDAATGSAKVIELDAISPFQHGVEAFSRAILNRESFPFPPSRDLHTMSLLDQARRQNEKISHR